MKLNLKSRRFRIVSTTSLLVVFLLELFQALPILAVRADDSTLPFVVSGRVYISSSEPVRGAEVQVYVAYVGHPSGLALYSVNVASGQTDEYGQFTIAVPYYLGCARAAGVFVRIFARSTAASVVDSDWYVSAPCSNTYCIRIPSSGYATIRRSEYYYFVNLGYTEVPFAKKGAYLILNVINDAWSFLAGLRYNPVEPDRVTVNWAPGNTYGSCFDFRSNEIHIMDSDEDDRNVVLHEYGHYVSDKYGFYDSEGGDHLTHKSDRFAWAEGWAGVFAIVVKESFYGERLRAAYGRTFPNGMSALGLFQNPASYPSYDVEDFVMSDCESAIRGVLLDAYDCFGFEKLWRVCYNYGPETIHEFWDGWLRQYINNISLPPLNVNLYSSCDLELGLLNYIFFRHGIDKNRVPTLKISVELLGSSVVVRAIVQDQDGRYTRETLQFGPVPFVEFQGAITSYYEGDMEFHGRDFVGEYVGKEGYLYSVVWSSVVWEDITRSRISARAKDSLGKWTDSDGNGIVDVVVNLYSDWEETTISI